MKRFRVTLILESEYIKDRAQVEPILKEQWEQTAAAFDGDTIEIETIEDVTK